MYMDPNFPPPDQVTGRLAQFMRLVQAFERDEIEAGVELLIAALDARDGDPDLEPTGDEEDHSHAEDESHDEGLPFSGAGCPIGDPGEIDDEDQGADDEGEHGSWPEGQQSAYNCIPDDDGEETAADRATRRPFRDMIRQTRCIVERSGTKFDGTRWVGYRLHNRPMPPMGIMAS